MVDARSSRLGWHLYPKTIAAFGEAAAPAAAAAPAPATAAAPAVPAVPAAAPTGGGDGRASSGSRSMLRSTRASLSSSTSVAKRVSEELGDPASMGHAEALCGYQIRGERRPVSVRPLQVVPPYISLFSLSLPSLLP